MMITILLRLHIESVSVHQIGLAIHIPRARARPVGSEGDGICHMPNGEGGTGVPARGRACHRSHSQQDGPTQRCQ